MDVKRVWFVISFILVISFCLLSADTIKAEEQDQDTHGNITVINQSDEDICYASVELFDSRSGIFDFGKQLLEQLLGLTWGENSLEDYGVFHPGETVYLDLPDGLYRFEFISCDNQVMLFHTYAIHNNHTFVIKPLNSSLRVINESGENICHISINPPNSQHLSGDWLKDEALSSGYHKVIELPSGEYSLTVFTCINKLGSLYNEGLEIILQTKIFVENTTDMWIYPKDALVTINNFSDDPICEIYLNETGQENSFNWLAFAAAEKIFPGITMDFRVRPGNYWLQIYNCKNQIEFQSENIEIIDEFEHNLTGENEHYYRIVNEGWKAKLEGDLTLAIEKYQEALTQAEAISNIENQISLLSTLSDLTSRVAEFDQAEEYLLKLLDLSRNQYNGSSELYALEQLSRLTSLGYISLSNKEVIKEYLILAISLDLEFETHLAYIYLGDYHFLNEEYEIAYFMYSKASVIDDTSAHASHRLGKYWNHFGYQQTALKYYTTAYDLETREIIGDQFLIAEILWDMGELYLSLGYIDKAYEVFGEPLDIFGFGYDSFGDKSYFNPDFDVLGGYISAMHISKFLYTLGDIENAFYYIEEALSFFEEINLHRQYSEALLMRSEIHLGIGELESAREDSLAAVAIQEQLAQTSSQADSYFLLGQIEEQDQNPIEALEYYQLAFEIKNELKLHKTIPDILSRMGFLYTEIGETELAIDTYKEAVEYIEKYSKDLISTELKLAYISDYLDVYSNLGNLYFMTGDFENSYYYLELPKSKSLRDILAGASYGYQEGNFYLTPEIDSVRAEIYQTRSGLLNTNSRNSERLESDLNYLLLRREELLKKLSIDSSYQPPREELINIRVSDLQKALPMDTTILEYFVFENKTLISVIGKDTIAFTQVDISQNELNELVTDLTDFYHPLPDKSEELSKLYDYLIRPIINDLTTHSLIIVPHKELYYLPFGMLVDGKKYLIDNYTISILPSSSIFPEISALQKKPNRNTAALLIGNPYLNSNLPALIHAEEEAANIGKLLGTPAITGRKATELLLVNRIKDSKILHLASHTELNVSSPLFSSILLAIDYDEKDAWQRVQNLPVSFVNQTDSEFLQFASIPINENDGYLELFEIFDLNLDQTEMVVLSGCDTQITKVSTGNEVIGFGSAFLSKKVPVVVSSLWTVEDRATAFLMENFYIYLDQGQNAASALRLAQIATREIYPHPYYWASFVLMGNGHYQLQVENSPVSLLTKEVIIGLMVGFLFTLLLISFFKLKKKMSKSN